MDKIGELFKADITDSNALYALQVFIETVISVCIFYIIYKLIRRLKTYSLTKKRSRSISDSGIELINVI